MTNFKYNDIIEYIDCTFDENFEDAKHWCQHNNAELIELMSRRDLPKRYFQITKNPEPTLPSEDELKAQVRAVRDSYLQETDFTQLPDAPFTTEEKAVYADYRQYLRDYTETEDWWKQDPKTFDEWKS